MSPDTRADVATPARGAATAAPGHGADAAPRRRRPRRRWVVLVAVALLLVGAAAARAQWFDRGDDIRDGTTAVSADGMAARHGIHVTLIGVTAAGGLVELRFQVVDPDKATSILHDAELRPALVVEETGETLVMSAPPHRHRGELELGASYFFLLANARSAVHAGSEVTLIVGDSRLEHIRVEG